MATLNPEYKLLASAYCNRGKWTHHEAEAVETWVRKLIWDAAYQALYSEEKNNWVRFAKTMVLSAAPIPKATMRDLFYSLYGKGKGVWTADTTELTKRCDKRRRERERFKEQLREVHQMLMRRSDFCTKRIAKKGVYGLRAFTWQQASRFAAG
jgi:hypothetical protein